jgi:hypothetical protein
VCKSAVALYLSVIKRECVTEVPINPIIRTGTSLFHHAYHPTHDNILLVSNSRKFQNVICHLFVPSKIGLC